MTEHKVVCPFCQRGEVYAEGTGKVTVTVMCPKVKDGEPLGGRARACDEFSPVDDDEDFLS